MNLRPAASGTKIPFTCAYATSRTSTNGTVISGNFDHAPVIMFLTICPDWNPPGIRFGPKTIPGLIATSSNLSFSGSFSRKSQAAFSARVFDLAYASCPFPEYDQS